MLTSKILIDIVGLSDKKAKKEKLNAFLEAVRKLHEAKLINESDIQSLLEDENEEKKTALEILCKENQVEFVQKFLQFNFTMTKKRFFYYSLDYKYYELATLLLKHKAPVELSYFTNERLTEVIKCLSKENDIETWEYLKSKGAQLEYRSIQRNNTVISLIIEQPDEKLFTFLLRLKPNTDLVFEELLKKQNPRLLKIFLKECSDFNAHKIKHSLKDLLQKEAYECASILCIFLGYIPSGLEAKKNVKIIQCLVKNKDLENSDLIKKVQFNFNVLLNGLKSPAVLLLEENDEKTFDFLVQNQLINLHFALYCHAEYYPDDEQIHNALIKKGANPEWKTLNKSAWDYVVGNNIQCFQKLVHEGLYDYPEVIAGNFAPVLSIKLAKRNFIELLFGKNIIKNRSIYSDFTGIAFDKTYSDIFIYLITKGYPLRNEKKYFKFFVQAEKDGNEALIESAAKVLIDVDHSFNGTTLIETLLENKKSKILDLILKFLPDDILTKILSNIIDKMFSNDDIETLEWLLENERFNIYLSTQPDVLDSITQRVQTEGKIKFLILLIKKGGSIKIGSNTNQLIIDLVCQEMARTFDIVPLLLKQGVDFNHEHPTEGRPATKIIERGDLQALKYLKDRNVDLSLLTNGETLADVAAKHKHLLLLIYLLENNIKLTINLMSDFAFAADLSVYLLKNDKKELFDELVKDGKLDLKIEHNNSTLTYEIIKQIKEPGINVLKTHGFDQNEFLKIAAYQNVHELFLLGIKYSGDVDYAFEKCLEQNKIDGLKICLEFIPKINYKGNDSLVDYALRDKKYEAAYLFLQRDDSILNTSFINNDILVEIASIAGKKKEKSILRKLINIFKAKVNYYSILRKRTPVAMLAEKGDIDGLRSLVQFGAVINVLTGDDNKTLEQLADQSNHATFKDALKPIRLLIQSQSDLVNGRNDSLGNIYNQLLKNHLDELYFYIDELSHFDSDIVYPKTELFLNFNNLSILLKAILSFDSTSLNKDLLSKYQKICLMLADFMYLSATHENFTVSHIDDNYYHFILTLLDKAKESKEIYDEGLFNAYKAYSYAQLLTDGTVIEDAENFSENRDCFKTEVKFQKIAFKQNLFQKVAGNTDQHQLIYQAAVEGKETLDQFIKYYGANELKYTINLSVLNRNFDLLYELFKRGVKANAMICDQYPADVAIQGKAYGELYDLLKNSPTSVHKESIANPKVLAELIFYCTIYNNLSLMLTLKDHFGIDLNNPSNSKETETTSSILIKEGFGSKIYSLFLLGVELSTSEISNLKEVASQYKKEAMHKVLDKFEKFFSIKKAILEKSYDKVSEKLQSLSAGEILIQINFLNERVKYQNEKNFQEYINNDDKVLKIFLINILSKQDFAKCLKSQIYSSYVFDLLIFSFERINCISSDKESFLYLCLLLSEFLHKHGKIISNEYSYDSFRKKCYEKLHKIELSSLKYDDKELNKKYVFNQNLFSYIVRHLQVESSLIFSAYEQGLETLENYFEYNGIQDINQTNQAGKTILHLAIENDQEEVIKFILKKNKKSRQSSPILLTEDSQDKDAIQKIIETEKPELISLLLEYCNESVLTHYFVEHYIRKVSKERKERKSSLSSLLDVLNGISGWLTKNANSSFLNIAREQILNKIHKKHELLVFEVYGKCGIEGLKTLRRYDTKFDLNEQNKHNDTLAHIATRIENTTLLQYLLKEGIDLTKKNCNEETILDIASLNNFEKVLPCLEPYYEKETFKKAVTNAYFDFIYNKYNNLALPYFKIMTHFNDISKSSFYDSYKTDFKEMLYNRIKVDCPPNTPLEFWAYEKGGFQLIEFLWKFEGKRDLNDVKEKKYGNTLLHKAVQKRDIFLFKLMLKEGVSPSVQNQSGETILHMLASFNQAGISEARKDFLKDALYELSKIEISDECYKKQDCHHRRAFDLALSNHNTIYIQKAKHLEKELISDVNPQTEERPLKKAYLAEPTVYTSTKKQISDLNKRSVTSKAFETVKKCSSSFFDLAKYQHQSIQNDKNKSILKKKKDGLREITKLVNEIYDIEVLHDLFLNLKANSYLRKERYWFGHGTTNTWRATTRVIQKQAIEIAKIQPQFSNNIIRDCYNPILNENKHDIKTFFSRTPNYMKQFREIIFKNRQDKQCEFQSLAQ